MPTSALLVVIVTFATLGLSSCAGSSQNARKEAAAIHYRLGVVHLNEGKLSEALEELTTAVNGYPDEPTFHNGLGLAYFAREMNKEAIDHLRKAISLDPKYSDARVNLGAVYIAEKQWDLVVAESSEALKNIFYRTPEFAYNNLGWALYNKGEFRKALEAFKKAVGSKPSYAIAWHNAGLTYSRLNMSKEAVESFTTAVEKAPQMFEAHYFMGLELLKIKDKHGARKAFEKVIELAPKSDRGASARKYLDLM